MSYDSTNTTVLATCEQADGNTRMLLLHTCEDGRCEYVVGSYFRQETVCEPFGPAAFPTKYSWDWGHYFGDVVSAADFWRLEVIGEELGFYDAMNRVCADCVYGTADECEFCLVRKTFDHIEQRASRRASPVNYPTCV